MKGVAVALAAVAIAARWTARARAAEPDVFAARCVVCHQTTARGVPFMYPPLADSIGYDVRLEHGRDYLIHVVVNGMSRPIEVKGTTYYGLMPQFSQLSDAEIAAALNEVLTRFNASEIPKDFAPITAAEVKRARAAPLSQAALASERASLMSQLKSAHADEATR